MIRRRYFFLVICLFLAAGGCFTYAVLTGPLLPEVDMVEVNRIIKSTAAGLSGGTFEAPKNCLYDYSVADFSGNILASFGDEAPQTADQALRSHGMVLEVASADPAVPHAAAFDVTALDGAALHPAASNPPGGPGRGQVLISTGYDSLLQKQQKKMAVLAAGMFTMLAVLAALYGIYLDKKLYQPFDRLQEFARHIAMGNLDVPLPMDKGHVFGAFSESFDIMREQLALSRKREAEAEQIKKELVASLSHDIKTPVTSIKLISELLLVTEKDTPAEGKIRTIYEKAEQIDRLITDMLHSTLEDLGQLTVAPEEKSSTILESMIRRSDYCGKVSMEPIPGCLILMDPLRTEQVIDNLINNSYKYADTEISVLSWLSDGCLHLEFRDYGDGVSEEELPKLIHKFYRGSNSQRTGKSGSGLGLSISHSLMSQMGGELQYFNRKDGFSTELIFRLA